MDGRFPRPDTASAANRAAGRTTRIRRLPLLVASSLVDATQGRPAVAVHVHSESLLTPELLPNTCNRTQTSSTPSAPSRLPLTDVDGWGTIVVVTTLPLLPLVGPCIRRHRCGHSSRVLHESARPRQGQISSVDAWTRGWHWTQHLACPARHTGLGGLARALPRPQS